MARMSKKTPHKWAFRARFRSRAYSWKGTQLASKRMREAVSEIKKVRRKDPVLAAQGTILLFSRLWPALQQIDSSSGGLGSAVNKTVEALLPVLIEAPADEQTRARWLEELWQIHQDDGVDFTHALVEHWGELCGSPAVASDWADAWLPIVRMSWKPEEKFRYFGGTPGCLSALLAAGRYQELLELIDTASYLTWHDRQYGFRALVAQGKIDEALAYAEASRGLNDPEGPIAAACEEILLASGRQQEAYRRFALVANRAGTHLATYRAVAKKYPDKPKEDVLSDLIATTPPGEEGKWFATAKQLGMFKLALTLARQSPVDPRTLNRAARDHVESQPRFAQGVGLLSLHWMSEGFGYEITGIDVADALHHALAAAERLGAVEETEEAARQIVSKGHPLLRQVLGRRLGMGHP